LCTTCPWSNTKLRPPPPRTSPEKEWKRQKTPDESLTKKKTNPNTNLLVGDMYILPYIPSSPGTPATHRPPEAGGTRRIQRRKTDRFGIALSLLLGRVQREVEAPWWVFG